MKIALCILLTAASAYSQVPFTREYIFVAPTWQTAEGSAANYYGAGFGRERELGARIVVGMEPPSPPAMDESSERIRPETVESNAADTAL